MQTTKKEFISLGVLLSIAIFFSGYINEFVSEFHDHEKLECHPVACERLNQMIATQERSLKIQELELCIVLAPYEGKNPMECKFNYKPAFHTTAET